MNKAVLILAFILFNLSLSAQKDKKPMPQAIKIPMEAGKWGFKPGTCEFLTYKSMPSMRLIGKNDTSVLKDFSFTNGTIEYDIAPEGNDFAGFYFRRQSSNESELFYLRLFAGAIPNILSAVQYTPVIKGVNLWNLMPYCQGPAFFTKNEWNHIKLVVSGAQMLVYVNDLKRPALEIPRLEGNTISGGLSFEGKAVIANLVVTPDATEGLSPVEGFDPFYNDPRYLRQWSVSQPIPFPRGRDLLVADLPKDGSIAWSKLWAERRGLVNLTRLYGTTPDRRLVWLRCRLKAPEAQVHHVDFGFTNDVWIFVNGKLAMVDKNFYDEIIEKRPRARCSTENTSFTLPLKAGVNEIMIGIANDFYGWGIIARMDVLEGIEVLND